MNGPNYIILSAQPQDQSPLTALAARFLETTRGLKIRSAAMIALVQDDTQIHDVMETYQAGPFELMELSNVLQLAGLDTYLDAGLWVPGDEDPDGEEGGETYEEANH